MKILLVLLLSIPMPAFAANWYVLKGATGTNAGTSWTNAWTEFNQFNSASVACGDTVWIGGGTYTTDMTVSKTCTSGNPLTIESVLSTDTVPTSAPGYTTAVLNQVIGPDIDVQGAYITVSGRKGTVGTEGTFGIVLQCASGNSCGTMTIAGSVNSSNITISEVELYGPPCVTSGGDGEGSCTGDTHAVDHGSNSVTNLLLDHMWMHRFAEIIRPYQWTNWTVQYSDLDTTRQTPDEHEDVVYAANPSSGTMAYNVIWGSPNDGIFFDFGGNALTFYGNVYYHSGGAFITFKSGFTNGAVVMYNNTFSSDTTFGDFTCPSNCPWIDWTGTPSSVAMENNIFDHVGFSGSPGTGDYNFYSTDVGKGDSGANSATYTSAFPPSNTQFVSISTSNPATSNYELTTAGKTLFATGTALSSPYNMDMNGLTRGINGWTIGAYQTPSAGASAPTCTPGSGTYVGSQNVVCTNPNSGTTIQCYTVDGSTPATNGSGTACTTGTALSSGGTVVVNSPLTLKIIAGTSLLPDSPVSSYTYAFTATTWYIRTDGGTATQCTGRANAAYPGTGSGQPCAFNHPFWLLNQSTWKWNIAASDTVQFEDVGPYYMGQQHNGHGMSWSHCAGGTADCYLPPFPDGVKFLGKNAGSCHTAGHTGTLNPTQLIGINFLFRMLSLQGTNNVDVECVDITQLTTCTSQGKQENTITNTSLSGGVATYSWTWPGSDQKPAVGMPITVTGTTNGGGVFNVTNKIITSLTGTTSGTFTVNIASGDVASAADTGTEYFAGNCATPGMANDYANIGIVLDYTAVSPNQGPRNATLKDISIHGLKSTAILGSKLNTSPSDTFTASDIYISGNGESGWDSDGGSCGSTCESQGTMNISYLTSTWNGCVEVEPNGGTIGGNGYNYCVDQAYAGNGDGIVMIATGGMWNWSHSVAEYNAQDGFDALHAGDDPVVRPTVNMSYMYSMGNEGQSIKNGGGQATIINSIGIANCNVFAVAANFPLNPAGWNALTQQRCRANDAMAVAMQDGDALTVEYVTNVGEQDVAWDFSTNNCTTNCVVTFKNNTTLGFVSPFFGVYPGAISISGANPFSNASSVASNNAWFHLGNSGTTCPGIGTETNYVCTDPLFVGESDINAIDVQLTSGSNLIGKGVAISGITTDFAGNHRPNPPSIGAYEFSDPPSIPTAFTGVITFMGNIQIH